MKAASYTVIRYVADPARNEPINIGIALWTECHSELRLDATALERVVRDNPHLHRDALLYLDPFLRERLASYAHEDGSGSVTRLLTERSLFPVVFTEPRFTSLTDFSPEATNATMERLLARVVKPRRRSGGGPPPNVMKILAKRLAPLVSRGAIQPNHVFASSRSGTPRAVDFFANSRANVALDVLRLNIQDARGILERADARAYKVIDVTEQNDVDFIVLCDFRPDDMLQETNDNARRRIESAGATVVTEPSIAAEHLESRVGAI
ncbi:MAG: DUF3037 domain-containing protein [Chloroflexia bacterium]|nr:DUF3037 domain-containing protein [Chloroflexia bacterium]